MSLTWISRTDPWISAADLESSNILKDIQRGAKDKFSFVTTLQWSVRDGYSSLPFFYCEDTIQMAAAFLSCILVIDKHCYTSFIEQVNVFHKGKVKIQIELYVCSTVYNM